MRRFVIIEADTNQEWSEGLAAFRSAFAVPQVTSSTDRVPDLTPATPSPVAPSVTSGPSAAEQLAQLQQQATPSNPLPVQQLVPVAHAPSVPEEAKGMRKRDDGLGMLNHKADCGCPADQGIRKQLSEMFGQAITAVPNEGTPEAAQWSAWLVEFNAPKAPAPVAVPNLVPVAHQQAAPVAAAPATPNAAAAGLVALQQASNNGQQAAAPAAEVAMPQNITEYTSTVYNALMSWAVDNLKAENKQAAMLKFLQGQCKLDDLKGIVHKQSSDGTLYGKVVQHIRAASK